MICIKIYSSSAASSAMPSIKFVTTALSSAAFWEVITGLPDGSSMAFLVSPAMLQPLIYPFSCISLFKICFQGSVDCQFGIDSFFNSFSTNLCQPHFKWLCFWRGNGLNNAKQLFGISHVCFIFFTIFRRF